MGALAAIALAGGLAGCAGHAEVAPRDPLAVARAGAERSNDGEEVARWMLAEMLVPGGTRQGVQRARARLDALHAKGLYASIGRGIDAEAHGRLQEAATSYLDALVAARADASPDAPLVGWFAANRLLSIRQSVQGLWKTARSVVETTIDHPGHVGWRARGELLEWWSVEGLRDTAAKSDDPDAALDLGAARYGCVTHARLAGPFGHGADGEHRVRYAAELPGPWPGRFERDPARLDEPRVLRTERRGCQIRAGEPVQAGIFYTETYVDLPEDREMIIAVQGAYAILVDDVEVLTRDTKQWGIWPRFGAHVRLGKGRHRILARVASPETSIRILAPDGTALGAETSDDPAPPYSLTRPTLLADPNPLEPFLTALGVPPQPGVPRPSTPRDTSDPISRFVAAYLAHVEGQDDVANVLIEPLVKDPGKATGMALGAEAVYVEKDPIFPPGDARDLAKDARTRAVQKDADLWWPRLWLALEEADRVGGADVAGKVSDLADRFKEVPDVLNALATIYGKLGWKAERAKVTRLAAERFPDDEQALTALMHLEDEDGRIAEADRIAAKIRALDPQAEIDLERDLDRRDYDAAIKELNRLADLRKDRRDVALRIADLLTRAGRSAESLDKLERALEKNPSDPEARLALADARFAGGDRAALHRALIDAIQTGSDTGALRDAIELVDGMNELSPFRLDGKKVIQEFEASKQELPGTAARVLDYSALWVHADGSARMLEHEIICIQSREAIQQMAEQKVPQGLVLHLRTIKKDGRVLEPEIVDGKPTVTMPHLEVGDYIETESISTLRGDGRGGRRFEGPRWFFREEKLGYFRSEFVVVSPKDRPLDIETGGHVPAPAVTEDGALVTRRWRVDRSPAVPEEPGAAPIQEYLPNVRIGWGISLDDTLGRMVDAVSDETPRDPRLARVAQAIVAGDGKSAPLSADEKARRVYRWVLGNVEEGREDDGRRIVIGKSGNRTEAFLYLCRLLGIDASLGVVRDRLTPPPTGPMSAAEAYDALAVRVVTDKGVRWMMVRDKFAPYGYLPSSLRGQPAIVLRPGTPHETTDRTGPEDGIANEGTATLAPDGTATLELTQRYEGKYGIQLRTGLEQVPDARLRDVIESKLLQQSLPGARLVSVQVKNADDLDAPLALVMKIEVPSFARSRGDALVISPPFLVQLGSLASLPTRETPLYLSEQIATRSVVKLRVALPEGAKVSTSLAPFDAAQGGRTVTVRDRIEPGAIVFDRVVDIPAGRVQPEAYAEFQDFARKGDTATHRDVVVELPAKSASR